MPKLTSNQPEKNIKNEGKDIEVVNFVEELPSDGDLVATTKRTSDGEPLPKQLRTDDPMEDVEPTDQFIRRPPVEFSATPHRGATRRVRQIPKPKRPKSKRKKTNKAKIHEHVGKYNVVSDFANAPSGITFGQLLRGDAQEATKQIRRILGKGAITHANAATTYVHNPRILRIVMIRIYGTET